MHHEHINERRLQGLQNRYAVFPPQLWALYGLVMTEEIEALNRSLALVLWSTDAEGQEDDAVFPGTLVSSSGAFVLERKVGANPVLKEGWLPRIQQVPEELKATLCDCDFSLSLTVGEAANDAPDFESFGLKWPS